jgi:hypothetical protein
MTRKYSAIRAAGDWECAHIRFPVSGPGPAPPRGPLRQSGGSGPGTDAPAAGPSLTSVTRKKVM